MSGSVPVSALMPTYARQPVAFVRGEGAWLIDEQGKRYLDALAGVAVCGLGHAHPEVAEAIARQATTLVHTSNIFRIPLQEQLGAVLCRQAGMEQVFFGNSGAEANEAAIKLARKFGHQKGMAHPAILVMERSFHGRTLATLSATGNAKVQAGFEPLVEGFVRVPYDDVPAVEAALAANANIVAILVEPVQGEGGVHVPAAGYLPALRALCDRHDLLLMLDEIQTGNGRTGRFFACQHEAVQPDVLTTAKGLGNGFPIGACMVQGKAAGLFGPGSHGSTYGGSPLACAAALTVLTVLERDHLPQRAEALGKRIRAGLTAALTGVAAVRDIRGRGLMIAIELDRPCAALVAQGIEAGILLNVTADTCVRLLPPLILSDAEADEIAVRVATLIRLFVAATTAATGVPA